MTNTSVDYPLWHPGLGLALLATAQLIITVDFSIVYVALPSIGTSLAFSSQSLQWVISAYALAFGGFMLLGGRLGDIVGRRRVFVTALFLYAASSLSGGLATSSEVLIISRAVQGIGGALLFPTTLSMISTYFAEGPARNKALGVMGAAGASGGAIGALLGGIITNSLGWSWTFFVNVPVVAVAIIAAFALLPKDVGGFVKKAVDVPGAILGTAGVTLLVLSCVEGPDKGWTSTFVLSTLAGSIALLAAFLLVESKTKAPLMPLRLFRHPTLSTAMLITLLFGAAFGAQYYLLTMYLQEIRLYPPFFAGLAFVPFAVSIIAGTKIGGRLAAGVGLRLGFAISLAFGIGGQSLVSITMSASGDYVTQVLPGLILDGLGQGATWTMMWIVATSGISAQDRGIASGMASSAQQIGAALGLALLVGITASASASGIVQGDSLMTGLQRAFLAAATLGILAGIVAVTRIKPKAAAVPPAAVSPGKKRAA